MTLWARATRRPGDLLQRRLTWQAASLLLAYPDAGHADRLTTAEMLIGHLDGEPGRLLAQTVAELSRRPGLLREQDYVETFDMQDSCTMLLTYWTAGDTRNRGLHMIEFTEAYRDAGVPIPEREAPDSLPVVLEFAATVDPERGMGLLAKYCVSLDVLGQALLRSRSAYAGAVRAVSATLPAADSGLSRRLLSAGPPAEAVGLEPFTLTVPPRRIREGV
ncbi:nitrate reductase molybdenum cofactor assembly chaperone [Mycolicibacterium neoaurum]|uniref:nitrate reductase molybdenum cofactor assembly chaperone n=1 Tax=Mycolicibacterium neoaurum TaxID=1795 RepID=UPI001BD1AB41|nr:nitrate reductase molybdenum cofactor assembly chaperone [Mycolicibacterium neoaurum]QVI26682.1 nitrate reductase molybdenum cofactor assembly chaperone [Mycolicibacterium neoaurum]